LSPPGKYVTDWIRNYNTNVALKVEDTADPDKFKVSGRGELHLSVLIENMRREGFEMAYRARSYLKEIDGKKCETFEMVTIEVEEIHRVLSWKKLGERKGDLVNMVAGRQKARIRLEYMMPSRGLIGFQTEFYDSNSGSGLLYHVFRPLRPDETG